MNKYLEMLKADYTDQKAKTPLLNTDLPDLLEDKPNKSVRSVPKREYLDKYEVFDLENTLEALATIGLQIVIDDKKFIRTQLQGLDMDTQRHFINEYKTHWINAMNKESASHCKQNAGRKSANTFLLESI